MGLFTWVKSLLKAVGKLFQSLKSDSKKAIEFGVNAVNWLKAQDAAHPEIADLITGFIPGNKDDEFKEKIRAGIPKLLVQMGFVKDVLNKSDTEILQEGIEAIKNLTGGPRTVLLHGLSVLIADLYADGEIDLKDLLVIQKWYYDHQNDEAVDTTTDTDGDGIPDSEETN